MFDTKEQIIICFICIKPQFKTKNKVFVFLRKCLYHAKNLSSSNNDEQELSDKKQLFVAQMFHFSFFFNLFDIKTH